MKPAYHISLTSREKILITELNAIQAQIEWLMRLTVQHLLNISPDTAKGIMGSTSIETNSNLWIKVIREKHPDSSIKQWAEFAFLRIKELSKGRNDFLHTLYGFAVENDVLFGPISFIYGHIAKKRHKAIPRRAVRVRTSAIAPLDDLNTARNEAAYLSVVFAHVEASANPSEVGRVPWLHRLGSKHPPQSQSVKPKKGKGRAPPPRS
jgi:hypothetical protein